MARRRRIRRPSERTIRRHLAGGGYKVSCKPVKRRYCFTSRSSGHKTTSCKGKAGVKKTVYRCRSVMTGKFRPDRYCPKASRCKA